MQDSKGKRGTGELAISLSLSTTPMVRKVFSIRDMLTGPWGTLESIYKPIFHR